MTKRKQQHGRKPQKGWHQKTAGERVLRASKRWPEIDAPHDGAPQPLRQKGRQANKKLKGVQD